jgi:hypothetical protein
VDHRGREGVEKVQPDEVETGLPCHQDRARVSVRLARRARVCPATTSRCETQCTRSRSPRKHRAVRQHGLSVRARRSVRRRAGRRPRADPSDAVG